MTIKPSELIFEILKHTGIGSTQFSGGRLGEYPIDKLFQLLVLNGNGITRKDIFDTALEYGGRECISTHNADENGDFKLFLSIILYPCGDSELSKKVREMVQSGKKLTLGYLSEEDQKELIELCYREMERTTNATPCESTFDLSPDKIVAQWANIFIAPYDDALGLDAVKK